MVRSVNQDKANNIVSKFMERKMEESKKSGRPFPFSFMVALSLATVAMPPVTMAQAQVAALAPSNEIKPAEVRIVSTEFRFSPATVLIAAGRAVTLVLDNRGAETEHGLFVPGLGFRLQAKAGEIARKNILVEKSGKYDYDCDLPGHRDAGMTGTLIVVDR
jgi:plastocyanin